MKIQSNFYNSKQLLNTCAYKILLKKGGGILKIKLSKSAQFLR